MRAQVRQALSAAILAMLPMFALNAHQSWASYDPAQMLTVEAPLSGLVWGDPLGTAKVMWNKAEWDVVLAPISRMEARGITQDMLSGGQTVTLVGYPRTDGSREMRIERMIVGDRTVELR